MKSIIIALTLFLVLAPSTKGQQISGRLTGMPNTSLRLKGFTNFDTYTIDSTQTDAVGNFKLNFTEQDYGIGLLSVEDIKQQIVILTDEPVTLQLEADQLDIEWKINQGQENIAFKSYTTEQPKREQALSAWRFLYNLYASDTIYLEGKQSLNAITRETERVHQKEAAFFNKLPSESYLRWYIPTRKLLASVSQVAQYRTEEIPATGEALRQLDFTDQRLYKSGLLKEAIDNHIWFIENSSGSLEQVFTDLNTSIDGILEQLKEDNEKFNLVVSRLFEVLEERSLFTSSEYLSKKLLAGDVCGCLNPDLEKRLHKYGNMATGQTAPDIVFTEYTYFPEGISVKKLSELEADHYLVVFAASWCGHCTKSIPEIAKMYPELQDKNIEVVLISLDENPKDFAQFAAPLPFISTTDYNKWGSKAAIDYQVYATPSYFMLDKDLKIVMKLKSVEHIKAWVEMNINNK